MALNVRKQMAKCRTIHGSSLYTLTGTCCCTCSHRGLWMNCLFISISPSLPFPNLFVCLCLCLFLVHSLLFQYSLSLSLPQRFLTKPLTVTGVPDQVPGKQSGKPIALIEVKSPWPLGKGGKPCAQCVNACVYVCEAATHSTKFFCHLSTPWRFNLSCLC